MTPYGDELSFSLPAGPGPGRDPVTFRFCQEGPLPGRMNALTGHSGSGKSGLLAQMALEAASGGLWTSPGREGGRILQFSRVMAVSHTGLDQFPAGVETPAGTEYLYLGMKKNGPPGHRSREEIAQGALDASLSTAANMGGAALERALRSLRE